MRSLFHRENLALAACALLSLHCSAGASNDDTTSSGPSSPTSSGPGAGAGDPSGSGGASTGTFGSGMGGDSSCPVSCSTDLHSIVDCMGTVVGTCSGIEGCDPATAQCANACANAETSRLSVGCEYYATFMDHIQPDACFAAFVANTWNTPVHISADWNGSPIDVAQIARLPSGAGPSLQYAPYDAVAGLPPGQVAILFLAGGSWIDCPIPAAIPSGAQVLGTGIGSSFRITTDVPVVTYQISPYGGGDAAVTAASLLLPTSSWDTNYIAVNITPYDIYPPSMNIVAREDGTTVTLLPVANVDGGPGVPAIAANQPGTIVLNRGQQAQITQNAELSGSVISSDKPVGFMAGQPCMRAPSGVAYCDHGEQMIPPIRALGSEYVGVMYRPRVGSETSTLWKLVGAVDGTELSWDPPGIGPATLARGQVVEFTTGTPFVVKSQDADHPFMLFTYMTSSNYVSDGYGDPDLVLSVPPEQYLSRYVFFADPTYPETNLVVVRSRKKDGTFADVTLDCLGVLSGWTPVGDYEWTRVDLSTGNFQGVGNCQTGAHEMTSEGRFGLWVWGWGTPLTSSFTENVSYGYPGGMNALPINEVVIPPTPR